MKTRLLFFSLMAGVSALVILVQMQRTSLPVAEQPRQSLEKPKQTNVPSSSRAPKQAFPLVSKQIQTNLVDQDLVDLVQRIREALKTGGLADHDLAINNLLPELIKKDPQSAANLAESMPTGPLREEMLRRLAQHWTEQDPDSARQWAEQLTDDSERMSVLTDISFQIAQKDPRQAVEIAEQNGLGKLPGATLPNLLQQWATKDFSAALAWANNRPAGEERDQMLFRIALVQAETSPFEAAQFVADHIPAGDAQTEAVISVLHKWAKQDMAGARAWVTLFPEGPLRERALNELNGVEAYQNAVNEP